MNPSAIMKTKLILLLTAVLTLGSLSSCVVPYGVGCGYNNNYYARPGYAYGGYRGPYHGRPSFTSYRPGYTGYRPCVGGYRRTGYTRVGGFYGGGFGGHHHH